MVYITVRYGDREQEIFNPYCRTRALLTNVKKKCQCVAGVDIELSDENGNVKNLRRAPDRYASEILTDRETLVLLQVQKNTKENEELTLYKPLLKDEDAITEDFLKKLAIPPSPSSRPHSRQDKRFEQKVDDIPTSRTVKEKSREKIKSARDKRKSKIK